MCGEVLRRSLSLLQMKPRWRGSVTPLLAMAYVTAMMTSVAVNAQHDTLFQCPKGKQYYIKYI